MVKTGLPGGWSYQGAMRLTYRALVKPLRRLSISSA